ncbi:uncharacterized protein [Leuresthes tenuis]|uniref:uncharacterized protein n=1 Tax=Leuresthes tenuis TaxID=355514 RepID=UPI003B504D92
MDDRNEYEIYIPVEAEVKSIPLQSVPNAVRRRIVHPLSPADSSEAIWISPAVVMRKGQGPALRRGSDVAENAASLLGPEIRDRTDPLQISFVSSNPAARELLKDVSQGTNPSHTNQLPHDSTAPPNQTAVIIYQGRLYLCIRGKRKPKACEPQQASPSAIPSTSVLSSKHKEKEVCHNRTPKMKHAHDNVKHLEKERVELKRKGAPQPPVSEPQAKSKCVKVARRDQALEEAALQPACVQPHEDQTDVASCVGDEGEKQDLGDEEADFNAQMDHEDADQSSSDPWNCPHSVNSLSADASSTSLHMEFDFSELAREEEIAQMKAKLMQSEAALKNSAL